MLAELLNLNRYLGKVIPFSSRSEFDLEEERVMMRLAESDPIWLVRVVSRLETCSLPSMPAMKLKLPKMNSLPGMNVTALMLNGAIKLDRLILMTPPTWRANCRCFLPAILFMRQVVGSQA